ncbi:H-NS histone family protein (plasmid) [Paraburkholderia sp. D15]|uniref:H-NS histone family protein n=1 Tax=Paraburkholderia sp. D15 TaxID=2880218 RepID=UPI0024788E12|nr:H-NS histone family protein [Paraburkholderia sp. D15]WGS55041.1 H-NS histone family protein [Paraburkholderia sp. D15]
MARYKELLDQKRDLEQRIEAARRAEAAAELERVRQTIAEFGFTPEQVFRKYRKGAGVPAEPKYRNAATGETWSGRGRTPRWLAGQDPESFRIKE